MPELLIVPPLETVAEALDAVVAERGEDYVYPQAWLDGSPGGGCLYVVPGGAGPACIAGAVFFRLGATVELLRECEHTSAAIVARRLWGDGEEAQRIGSFLTVAQLEQDFGETWGTARDKAFDVARREGWLR